MTDELLLRCQYIVDEPGWMDDTVAVEINADRMRFVADIAKQLEWMLDAHGSRLNKKPWVECIVHLPSLVATVKLAEGVEA